MFAFPKCTSPSRPQQWFLSPRLSPHVYAFVPHYSASASTDPHLAFKFPDQHASHALMTRLLLQLNSLCSSYSDQTCCLLGSQIVMWQNTVLLWYNGLIQGYAQLQSTYLTKRATVVWFDLIFYKSWDTYLKIPFGSRIPAHNPWIESWNLFIWRYSL